MALPEFNLLFSEGQLSTVFSTGHYLARRWQAEDEAVHLYELPGRFFAELTYNTTRNEIIDLLSFGPDDKDQLEDYAVAVRLPDWLE